MDTSEQNGSRKDAKEGREDIGSDRLRGGFRGRRVGPRDHTLRNPRLTQRRQVAKEERFKFGQIARWWVARSKVWTASPHPMDTQAHAKTPRRKGRKRRYRFG